MFISIIVILIKYMTAEPSTGRRRGIQYKWVALSNTTIGTLMASINSTIILISLPPIFKGIDLNPLATDSFAYLLWILMGYNIITATLLVTFGRLSDMYGRTRLFNLGFVIFTIGSILLYLTPGKGSTGAIELIVFRLFQGAGAAFLFSNSAAILTDAFPVNERGKALGLNQVAFLAGSFIGLILGGILAVINWRYVFLVSVPVGAFGSIWSILKLKDNSRKKGVQRIDYVGNTLFSGGLTLVLIGVTYGLMPYGSSVMGWNSPWVIAAFSSGGAMLIAFPFVEARITNPMFDLSLFRIRAFTFGNFASFLSAIGRGGVMLMLIILLQGIWLPLHGYSYASTPFWAGVYMVPMTVGFIVMGPISGALSDRYGARFLATMGMVISALAFLVLSIIPYNFTYLEFGASLFVLGIGSGMFAAPNTAAIMNSVPMDERGVASGMRSTLANTGQTISLGIFFTIVILGLAALLPSHISASMASVGVPQGIISVFSGLPPTGSLFAAFLGEDPVKSVLITLPPALLGNYTSTSWYSAITASGWFPTTIAPAFMPSLRLTFYAGAILSAVAAVLSALRGKRYVHEDRETTLEASKSGASIGEASHNLNSQVPMPDGEGKAAQDGITIGTGSANGQK